MKKLDKDTFELLHLLFEKDVLFNSDNLEDEIYQELLNELENTLDNSLDITEATASFVNLPKVPEDFKQKVLVLCKSHDKESLDELSFELLSKIFMAIKLSWDDIRVYCVLPHEQLALEDFPEEVQNFDYLLCFGIHPEKNLNLVFEVIPHYLCEIPNNKTGIFAASLSDLHQHPNYKRDLWNGLQKLKENISKNKA